MIACTLAVSPEWVQVLVVAVCSPAVVVAAAAVGWEATVYILVVVVVAVAADRAASRTRVDLILSIVVASAVVARTEMVAAVDSVLAAKGS